MQGDLSRLERLRQNDVIFRLIAEWTGSELQLQHRLRGEFPDEVVRDALTLAQLRKKAAAKFLRPDEMWFDRVGLEQSTAEAVARHKAARFHGRVWDYCCGIGADALALAERCDVVAVDLSAAACLCTQWNAEVYGVAPRVTTICADVETLADRSGLVHIDPDRRSPERDSRARSLRLEEGHPGLEFLHKIMEEFPGGAIKSSPAANFVGKFPTAEIELVSLNGECKEATIWFGTLAQPGIWRATLLPAGETITGDPLAAVAPLCGLGRFLYDPDPAVVRSGLVDVVAIREGLSRLDPEEEYLTGEAELHSSFVRGFEVLADLPNNAREIRDYFRKSAVGQLEIKCRRIPIDVEATRRKLTLPGDESAVLIFARIEGRARAVIGRRIVSNLGERPA